MQNAWHCALLHDAAIIAWARGNYAAAAIGLRCIGVAWHRMGAQRKPPRCVAATGGHRLHRHVGHRRDTDKIAVRRPCLRRHQRCRGRDFGGLARGHLVRVRLSRRRHAAVRPEGARRGFHSGVSGAPHRAGDERADHTSVLLAHPAPSRARHGVGPGAHAWRRRRGRVVARRQYFSGHGGSTIVHPALPGAADAQRIVSGDDRRHGGYSRHRAGALCHAAGAADPGCRGAFRDCVGAGRTRGDPGQPDHGAGGRWQAHRRYARGARGRRWRPPGRTRPRPRRLQHHGCDRQRHDGRT